jgi:hypothetical protein
MINICPPPAVVPALTPTNPDPDAEGLAAPSAVPEDDADAPTPASDGDAEVPPDEPDEDRDDPEVGPVEAADVGDGGV